MRAPGHLLCLVSLASVLVACSAERNVVPAGPSPFNLDAAEHHNPGHGGGGGGGGGAPGGGKDVVTIEVQVVPQDPTVGFILDGGTQAFLIRKDTKSRLSFAAGLHLTDFSYRDEIRLWEIVGSPSVGNLGDCIVDPVDVPDAVVQQLIDATNDGMQEREHFTINIDRNALGGPSSHHGLNHFWVDDSTGRQYRTWIHDSFFAPETLLVEVSQIDNNTYDFSSGNIVTWQLDTDAKLVCPNSTTFRVIVSNE